MPQQTRENVVQKQRDTKRHHPNQCRPLSAAVPTRNTTTKTFQNLSVETLLLFLLLIFKFVVVKKIKRKMRAAAKTPPPQNPAAKVDKTVCTNASRIRIRRNLVKRRDEMQKELHHKSRPIRKNCQNCQNLKLLSRNKFALINRLLRDQPCVEL